MRNTIQTTRARSMRRTARAGALTGIAFSALLLGCFALVGRAQGPGAAAPPGPAATPGQPGAQAAPVGGGPAPDQVRITLITVPSAKKVFVHWGKKRLGIIAPHQPLVIQRPRDSGPLDLIIRSEGYLSVQTRAFTFADSKVAVKLTPVDQKKTLLGYREEVPLPAAPDGGVPPPAQAAPTPPSPPVPFNAPPAGVAPFVPDARGR
jgi:hypothetical protein